MIIGTVREMKTGENRVGLTPEGTEALTRKGHTVLVEKNAGMGSGFSDSDYKKNGAKIIENAADVWKTADMIIKVKEPLHNEFGYLRQGLILFTYLHLAAEPDVTQALLENKVTGIAYETIEVDGTKPLLSPMSEVAGRMSIQVGMHYLERTNGGSGKLLSGVTGVQQGTVTIIGSGVAGMNAAKVAHGTGAQVIMIGIVEQELKKAESLFPEIITKKSTPENIEWAIANSDLVIGSVAITGASAPKLVTREMIKKMNPGSVVVDISIDQGGCFETSKPTSHTNPVFVEEGVTHYCVTNMPGAVPYTSTLALTAATLPFAIKIADKGLINAVSEDKNLLKGINTYNGKLTNEQVARALSRKYELVTPSQL